LFIDYIEKYEEQTMVFQTIANLFGNTNKAVIEAEVQIPPKPSKKLPLLKDIQNSPEFIKLLCTETEDLEIEYKKLIHIDINLWEDIQLAMVIQYLMHTGIYLEALQYAVKLSESENSYSKVHGFSKVAMIHYILGDYHKSVESLEESRCVSANRKVVDDDLYIAAQFELKNYHTVIGFRCKFNDLSTDSKLNIIEAMYNCGGYEDDVVEYLDKLPKANQRHHVSIREFKRYSRLNTLSVS
jgi:hypothetical protein